jgi:dihydroorotate dehydrogenase (fumarate)
MDLSTTYLGFKLPHPLMPGASPLVDDLDTVRRLEDAGAAAIVMHSLFEEQITLEALGRETAIEMHEESFAEAMSYFPRPEDYRLGPDQYLEQLRKIKAAVKVPVIASLNGTSVAGWLDYAKLLVEAGADALELNVYYIATQPWEASDAVERRTLDVVATVRKAVKVPIAVKLSPYFSALTHFAHQLDELGVDGLVLFNASTSRTSTWRSCRVCARSSSRTPRSCPCGCAGWRSCRAGSVPRWPSRGASTRHPTPSRP